MSREGRYGIRRFCAALGVSALASGWGFAFRSLRPLAVSAILTFCVPAWADVIYVNCDAPLIVAANVHPRFARHPHQTQTAPAIGHRRHSVGHHRRPRVHHHYVCRCQIEPSRNEDGWIDPGDSPFVDAGDWGPIATTLWDEFRPVPALDPDPLAVPEPPVALLIGIGAALMAARMVRWPVQARRPGLSRAC